MRRRVLVALLGGVLLPAGLAACGIPNETEVQVDGPGPAAEAGALNGSPARPPTPGDSVEPVPFIENYLRAAAAGEREQAYARAKEFVGPEAKGLLPEKQQSSEIELTVVRLLEKPEVTPPVNQGTRDVTIKVQQVGVLRADGSLDAPEASETEYKFRLRRADPAGPGLLLTEVPNVLLVSDTALREYYRSRTIYFWDSAQSRLVPELRYLPSSVPAERRVTDVVKWLTGGPSKWLAQGVTGLPDGTRPINNATGADGHWEVNLTMPGADDKKLGLLATQLAWSLPELSGQLDLKIQNQKRRTVDLEQERAEHAVYPAGDRPARYAVYDGAVRPLAIANEARAAVPLVADFNKSVVAASFARADDQVLAALVVTAGDRRQRLKVGSGPDPVAVFDTSKDTYGTLSRPTWLRSLDGRHPAGLVAADGKLYRFDGAAGMTPVPLAVAGSVVAVAGSLDGHRIALVIGGALYVAAVNVDGGVVSVGRLRPLVTLLTDISAADWVAENDLVVAGNEADRRPAIHQITVDGAQETALKRDIGAEVTQLAAYPGSAVGGPPALSYMYEANKAAFRNNPIDIIKREQVLDVPAGSRATNPTAPFFLY
ncbi:LpqB family beta-propeller domain-containing protein [Micromonospora chersina]|uniref:LpqB family beta-propeller domain-containing protein n=1 Tax=Micromonospora chersina TaxID=47854 RepID=UPI00371547D6